MARNDDEDDRPARDRFGDDDDAPRRPARKKGGGTPVWVFVLIGLGVCCVGGVPVAIGLMLPAVQKVREAAARSKDMNNMKQIGIAVHNHQSAIGLLPAPQFVNNSTRELNPGLSHRVALLPFIEQENLYRQFKITESWDSAANRPLSNTFIPTFHTPTDDPGTATTRYQGFAGPGAMYDPGFKRPLHLFNDITDGTSNTILLITGDPPVVWSKPQDIPFDPNGPAPSFGGVGTAFPGGTNVLMADGSVRFLRSDTPDMVRKALITRNGGETLPADW